MWLHYFEFWSENLAEPGGHAELLQSFPYRQFLRFAGDSSQRVCNPVRVQNDVQAGLDPQIVQCGADRHVLVRQLHPFRGQPHAVNSALDFAEDDDSAIADLLVFAPSCQSKSFQSGWPDFLQACRGSFSIGKSFRPKLIDECVQWRLKMEEPKLVCPMHRPTQQSNRR